MNIRQSCVAIALLTDVISVLDGGDAGRRSALRAGRTFAFGDLPKAYRDAFAACLADEAKLLRVHRAATPERFRHELSLWVEELTHNLLSPNAELTGSKQPGKGKA